MPLNRFLIVKPSSLGDIVHAFPLASFIRKQIPEARIDWVANTEFVSLVKRHPDIRTVFAFPRGEWGSLAFFRSMKTLVSRLREENYDAILDIQGLLRSALLARLARGKTRIGFSDAREGARFLYSTSVNAESPSHGAGIHAVLKNLQVMTALGFSPAPVPSELLYSSEDEQALDRILEEEGLSKTGFLVLHPGAKRIIKQWPSHYFSELIERLHASHPDLSVVMIAGKKEKPLLAEIADRTTAHPVVLAGRIPIDLLPLFFRRTRLYIGNDSGPLHLAVLSGVPTISIFGSSNPERTGPFGFGVDHIVLRDPIECSPCGDFKTDCSHQSCLVGVTPERVQAEAERVLSSREESVPVTFRNVSR
ncbi:MAG: glycosyltransferase family 9 protein [Leptospirales bacterium]